MPNRAFNEASRERKEKDRLKGGRMELLGKEQQRREWEEMRGFCCQ